MGASNEWMAAKLAELVVELVKGSRDKGGGFRTGESTGFRVSQGIRVFLDFIFFIFHFVLIVIYIFL